MNLIFALLISSICFSETESPTTNNWIKSRLRSNYDANSSSSDQFERELTDTEKKHLKDGYVIFKTESEKLKSMLQLKTGLTEVRFEELRKGNPKWTMDVSGIFTGYDWTIIFADKVIVKGETKSFQYRYEIRDRTTVIDVSGIDPLGAVHKGQLILEYPLFDLALAQYLQKLRPKKTIYNLAAGLGVMSFSHVEAGVNSYKSNMVIGKFSFNKYLAFANLDLGIAGFGTLAEFGKNRTDASVRLFGLNTRVGYLLPVPRFPWRVGIYAGWYYLTMATTVSNANQAFGYQNVAGPQVFPTVRYALKNGDSFTVFSKVSPISDKFVLLSLKSREFSGGISYNHVLNDRNSLLFSLEHARVRIDLDEGAVGTVRLNQKFTTLAAGISF